MTAVDERHHEPDVVDGRAHGVVLVLVWAGLLALSWLLVVLVAAVAVHVVQGVVP